MTFKPTYVALCLAALAAPAHAQGFADPAAIDRAVASFLGVSPADAGSAFVPVDRRLRLAACSQPLALGWQGTRRDSVLVQCPDLNGWKIYVRVAGQAAAAAATPIVQRGDGVTVTVKGGGFSVSQVGTALESGAAGDWIRVRAGQGAELQAQVVRPGAVVVPMN